MKRLKDITLQTDLAAFEKVIETFRLIKDAAAEPRFVYGDCIKRLGCQTQCKGLKLKFIADEKYGRRIAIDIVGD